jgi:hypothetical protein
MTENKTLNVAKGKGRRRHPLEEEIERGFCPGAFISYRTCSDFVGDLETIEAKLSSIVKEDPVAAVSLYDAFLAGSFEKANEIDDSEGDFGRFVGGLYCGWIAARQAAGMDADETAIALLSWVDRDPYGFTYEIEKDAAKAFDKNGLKPSRGRSIRIRFDDAA